MASVSWIWSAAYFLGMLLVFMGERVIGAGSGRYVGVLGLALSSALVIVRMVRAGQVTGERRRTERTLAFLYALGIVAVVLYGLQSDLVTKMNGRPLEHDFPKLAGMLATVWVAIWALSAMPILFVEISYAAVRRAPKLDEGRISDAFYSGIGFSCALIFAFAACYIATERDHKVDLSYFRTTRPGESTRKVIRTLDAPIDVALFFPPSSDVKEEVASYFNDLQGESAMLRIASYDHAADPAKAKEYGVSGNGIVVIAKGTRREQISLGTELEGARTQLRSLDKEVQKRILQVARPTRNLYITYGHGERAQEPVNDTDKRFTIRDFREGLTQMGHVVRNLGAAEGLATDVPNDAAAVIIIGPQKPFLPEEYAALDRYISRGGRIFLALDAENPVDFEPLLKPLGVKFVPTQLANDQVYGRRTGQPIDHINVYTNSFSSHPSVTTLGRIGRAVMFFVGAGHIDELQPRPKDVLIDYTVHALGSTFMDENLNYAFDVGEKRKAYELAAVITKKNPQPATPKSDTPDAGAAASAKKDDKKVDEGRVILLADSDTLADGVLGVAATPMFLSDGFKWLLGDEGITGEITSEVDVPIAHTQKQDSVWFYSTVFLAPALVLAAGFLATRRRRAARRRKGDSGGNDGSPAVPTAAASV